jgi:hypothetical protein
MIKVLTSQQFISTNVPLKAFCYIITLERLKLLLTFLLHVFKTKQKNDNAHKVDQTSLHDNLFHKTTSWAVRVRGKQSVTADLPFYFEPCAGEPYYPWHSEA